MLFLNLVIISVPYEESRHKLLYNPYEPRETHAEPCISLSKRIFPLDQVNLVCYPRIHFALPGIACALWPANRWGFRGAEFGLSGT